MKDKPIRKMSREELLELLIKYTEEKEALERKVAQMESKLAEAEKKLADRALVLSRAGSIAEAALQLSGVFEAAQRAADQYLENVRKQYAECATGDDDPEVATKAEAGNDEKAALDEQSGLTRRRKRGMGL